jgi:hypothetical protein
MNEPREIRERVRCVLGNSFIFSLDEFPTEDDGSGLGAVSNANSKHSVQIPFALTGVVHLLYFFPQVLQMAIVRLTRRS